jgi:radical SAM-linked protein
MKVTVRYSKLGKVRFTSHRDAARLWERALRKAQVPVAFSGGFTPRPKISFGLALPTGAESVAEYLDIELAPGYEPALPELAAALDAALPPGFGVVALEAQELGVRSLQEAVVACRWEITLTGVDGDTAVAAAKAAMAATALPVERERKGERRVDDVRPTIESLEAVVDGDVVRLDATVTTDGRGLRPGELAEAVLGRPALDIVARVLRTHQWIEQLDARREVIPLTVEAGATG